MKTLRDLSERKKKLQSENWGESKFFWGAFEKKKIIIIIIIIKIIIFFNPKTRPEVNREGEVTIVEVEERAGGVTAAYTGESGFSVAVRGAQHLKAMENPQSHGDNAFAKHTSNYHQGEEEEVQYGLELVGHFTKPVEQLVYEGVYIHSDPSDLVMNDKLDHHLPAVARVTYSNSAADRGEGGRRG